MTFAKIKNIVEKVMGGSLGNSGFERAGVMFWVRSSGFLWHGVKFYKHKDRLFGDVFLKYQNAVGVKPDEAMDCSERLGDWAFDKYQTEEEFSEVAAATMRRSLLFASRFETAKKILDEVEGGNVDSRYIFGRDIGWRTFNLATLYIENDFPDKAKALLTDVIANHSGQPFEWVQERRRLCEELLRKGGQVTNLDKRQGNGVR